MRPRSAGLRIAGLRTAGACLLLAALAGCTLLGRGPYAGIDRNRARAYRAVEDFLDRATLEGDPVKLELAARVDTIVVDPEAERVAVHFNDYFAHISFREANTALIYEGLREALGRRFRSYELTVYALDRPIETLIPNYFRGDPATYDEARLPVPIDRPAPLARNLDRPVVPEYGLAGRNVALWPSHGWYYEQTTGRWEWQRARLFQTVEDLLPMAFVVPYLVPMLENAGAGVFLPRERDVQVNEVLVDNGAADSAYVETTAGPPWMTGRGPGFGAGEPPYGPGVNPFQLGTYRQTTASAVPTASAVWVPDLPEAGSYAVYVAYPHGPDRVTDARYTVHHAGGTTRFAVNQQIGGGTWVYLGTFAFEAGRHVDGGRVELSNESAAPGRRVVADAVRFGGGIGNVARDGQPSGRPRFVEGARYYMQYAGMPDSLVYNLSGGVNDYSDDYRGRGEWVNYLRGAPYGPNANRAAPGLRIPIDLSLAFHTDAGIRPDTTIGTLMIYSREGQDTTLLFPDGQSRFANRDLADVLQTQIVDDIRALYEPAWTRRSIWDRGYSEAVRPNVPSALLELLSHQNFYDMQFALDPRFRFDVGRAVYKGILRFIAAQERRPYVVQPLPPSHLQLTFEGADRVRIAWQPVVDSLETTAAPDRYVVYTRTGARGFDNGVEVEGTDYTVAGLEPGVVYSFKVTAVNEGGESFPTEILSAARAEGGRGPVLVVNAFDRVSGPAVVAEETFQGFAHFEDQGVPDRFDLNFTGYQYNFNVADRWTDDDAPGHGASYGDFETLVVPGNTFDFTTTHGAALLAAGYGYVSVSDDAVMDGHVDLTAYDLVDVVLGEERRTIGPGRGRGVAFEAFPTSLQAALRRFADGGGGLFVSGAYVGTDLAAGKPSDHPDVRFARDVLHITYRTHHAARTGRVVPDDTTFAAGGKVYTYNAGYHPEVYTVEAPDALDPAGGGATTLLRYAENNMSAGVGYRGDHRVVTLGFPFEAIPHRAEREALMARVLAFLTEDAE